MALRFARRQLPQQSHVMQALPERVRDRDSALLLPQLRFRGGALLCLLEAIHERIFGAAVRADARRPSWTCSATRRLACCATTRAVPMSARSASSRLSAIRPTTADVVSSIRPTRRTFSARTISRRTLASTVAVGPGSIDAIVWPSSTIVPMGAEILRVRSPLANRSERATFWSDPDWGGEIPVVEH